MEKIKRLARWGLGLGVIGLLVVECVLRSMGYGEFPIYQTDSQIGYIPAPNQAGLFAGKYPWYFNEHSMRNDPFAPAPERGVLLLGDSIVFGGGIDFMPADRLGACLQAAAGASARVWNAGAGSWSLLNELTYLRRNPDVVVGVRRIVWVVNSGDWESRSQWATDLTHPRSRPKWLTLYLACKVLAPKFGFGRAALNDDNGLRVSQEVKNGIANLPELWRKKIVFVWYPDRDELKTRSAQTRSLCAEAKKIVIGAGCGWRDVRSAPTWTADLYRDPIHPSPEGNRVLASILSELL